MAFTIQVNGTSHDVDVDGDTPLLWVLRDVLGMTGTKFGCGKALCGACTVHVDGVATRSCITSIDSIDASEITTIEAVGATAAGAVRWSVMAITANVAAMALVEPLHGLSFALLHLACMRLLGRLVPPSLIATAQAIYGTVAIGVVSEPWQPERSTSRWRPPYYARPPCRSLPPCKGETRTPRSSGPPREAR